MPSIIFVFVWKETGYSGEDVEGGEREERKSKSEAADVSAF